MRRLSFLLGFGFGFILGSRAGSGPYEQLEAKVRSVTFRDDVQEAVDKVKGTAQGPVDSVAHRVRQQVTNSWGGSERGADASVPTAEGLTRGESRPESGESKSESSPLQPSSRPR